MREREKHMTTRAKQLEEKHERLTIALQRLSKDKKEARQSLMADINNVRMEIAELKKAPAKQKKPVNIGTIILISVILAVGIGFVAFFSGGGKI